MQAIIGTKRFTSGRYCITSMVVTVAAASALPLGAATVGLNGELPALGGANEVSPAA
jgi:hypothetical protein